MPTHLHHRVLRFLVNVRIRPARVSPIRPFGVLPFRARPYPSRSLFLGSRLVASRLHKRQKLCVGHLVFTDVVVTQSQAVLRQLVVGGLAVFGFVAAH